MTDRELDALVAEKVMGIDIESDCPGKVSWDGWYEAYTCGLCGYEYGRYYPHDPDGHDRKIAHYSTDISAAWEVVEKMVDSGFPAMVQASKRIPGMRDGWYCQMWDQNEEGPVFDSLEPTAPRAICLAALKAKGVKV